MSHYPVAISVLSVRYLRTNPLLNRDHPLISGGLFFAGARTIRGEGRDPVSVDSEGVLTVGAVSNAQQGHAERHATCAHICALS